MYLNILIEQSVTFIGGGKGGAMHGAAASTKAWQILSSFQLINSKMLSHRLPGGMANTGQEELIRQKCMIRPAVHLILRVLHRILIFHHRNIFFSVN